MERGPQRLWTQHPARYVSPTFLHAERSFLLPDANCRPVSLAFRGHRGNITSVCQTRRDFCPFAQLRSPKNCMIRPFRGRTKSPSITSSITLVITATKQEPPEKKYRIFSQCLLRARPLRRMSSGCSDMGKCQ